jgi:hypothetical protein
MTNEYMCVNCGGGFDHVTFIEELDADFCDDCKPNVCDECGYVEDNIATHYEECSKLNLED